LAAKFVYSGTQLNKTLKFLKNSCHCIMALWIPYAFTKPARSYRSKTIQNLPKALPWLGEQMELSPSPSLERHPRIAAKKIHFFSQRSEEKIGYFLMGNVDLRIRGRPDLHSNQPLNPPIKSRGSVIGTKFLGPRGGPRDLKGIIRPLVFCK